MERDFLGLVSKENDYYNNSSQSTKQSAHHARNGFLAGSTQWPFGDQGYPSGPPQFSRCGGGSTLMPMRKNVDEIQVFPLLFLPTSNGHTLMKPPPRLADKTKNFDAAPWKSSFVDETARATNLSLSPAASFTTATADLGNIGKASEEEPAQMTIIYANGVHIYEDVSFDKANAIFRFAKDNDPEKVADQPVGAIDLELELSSIHSNSTVATVPQARRATMKHFLEKRQHRLMNREMVCGFLSLSGSLAAGYQVSRADDEVSSTQQAC